MRTNPINRIVGYLRRHLASLGVVLASYGALLTYAVLCSGWTPSDGIQHTITLTPAIFNPPLPNSYLIPVFFATSFPALLIGTIMLYIYSIRVLRSSLTVDSEHVAVLLTVSGFVYQVLGAWPLQDASKFPWEWQRLIMGYGPLFAWVLYLLSLAALVIGAVLLFVHSRDYHRWHPELSHG